MENTVKYRKFILPIVVGLFIWALTPFKPDALNDQAWYMFAIFVADYRMYHTTYDHRCCIYHWLYDYGTRWHYGY